MLAGENAHDSPTLTPMSELRFGGVVACAEGTVTIAPTGARTADGGVVTLSTSPGSAAMVRVSLPAGRGLHVMLPDQIELRAPGHFQHVMVADRFTSSLPAHLEGGLGTTQVLAIGATLHVAPDQPPGTYSGTVPVILDYD